MYAKAQLQIKKQRILDLSVIITHSSWSVYSYMSDITCQIYSLIYLTDHSLSYSEIIQRNKQYCFVSLPVIYFVTAEYWKRIITFYLSLALEDGHMVHDQHSTIV